MAELSVEDWRKSVEPHLSGIDRLGHDVSHK